ncbi:MAG: hypothetical protein GYA55_03240, partial [SAR324 cluster bacterium]|nr:hypothetical protein [SAR324 cluster bacterium]
LRMLGKNSVKILALMALLLACLSESLAQQLTSEPVIESRCKNTVQLGKFRDGGILYKPENVHGGRGVTFLVQNFKYWFGPKKKNIYDINCKKRIGSVVMWSRGYAYGERYYSRPYGSRDNGASLARKARNISGRPGGIVIVNREFSVRIKDFRKREGFVRAP